MSLKLKEAFDPESHQEDAIERAAKSYQEEKDKEEKAKAEADARAKKILEKRETEEAFGKTLDEEEDEK